MNIKSQNSNKTYVSPSDKELKNGLNSNLKNGEFEILKQTGTSYEVRNKNGKKFSIEVLSFNTETKNVGLMVNGRVFNYLLEDELDVLLQKLGMDSIEEKSAKNLIAPMPGMVLNILIKKGDSVSPGQSLLVLEAMKMENIIKAQYNSVVKDISVELGSPVEKGQVLIEFE